MHRLEAIAVWQVPLLTLQALQVAFLWLHDWIPLGRFNDVAAARGTDTPRLIRTTLMQSIPYSIGLWFSARFFGHAYPEWLRIWLWISYGLLILGEIRAWWWPYLVRPDLSRAARYQRLFGSTHTFLPRRHGMVPNTLHVVLHALTAATLLVLPIASAPEVRSTATITIAAPPERVWRLLAAIEEWPRWNPNVTAARTCRGGGHGHDHGNLQRLAADALAGYDAAAARCRTAAVARRAEKGGRKA